MLLKSLELQGFKTFPEKTVLLFDEGITAIVGPNGSGKSNISDAIRWILGEQSIRTLRCSKMEDVIFNGTTERKAKGFASASLTIINDDRRLPINSDEIIITRRYYRSGESEYLINKNEVRLKDIHELFMDTGLGRDGYSMIVQGKIDSIVDSKSEDRREIFEEAAGISKYRYRKVEAQRKLEQAEDNLLRLRDIINELEARVGPLKEQSQKAKIYLDLSNKKKSIEIGTWLFTLCKSGDTLKDLDDKIEVSTNQHEEVEKDLENFTSSLDKLSKNILSHTVNVDETRREISNCEENAIKKSGDISVLQNDILHNNDNIEKLNNEISSLTESFKSIDNDLKEKKENIETLKVAYEEKNNNLEKHRKEFNNLVNHISSSSNKSTSLSDKLSELSKLASEQQVKNITSKSTIFELNSRQNELNKNIDSYKLKIDEINEDLNPRKNKLELLKKDLQKSHLNLKENESYVNEHKEKCEKLKHSADKLTLDADSQIRKVRLLQELERNLDGFTHSVKFIMKEAQKGSLSGIHGPISRLIKVPDKYSVAVETALGSAMQNIVVNNEEDAKKAIILLKNKNIGRATFLPIPNIKGTEIKKSEIGTNKGFIGVANQLCSYDPKYKDILSFLLGRVVIVDNIDNAVIIAKKVAYKFRIVTLDGQVINTGGSLTGGSLSKNAGILNRAAQIEILKKEANELEFKAKNARMSYNDELKELNENINNLSDLKADFENAKNVYTDLNNEYQQKLLEMNSLKSVCERLEREKNELSGKINDMTLAVDDSSNEFLNISTQIKATEKALSQIGVDLNELSKERESMNTKIHEAHLEVFAIKKDIDVAESEVSSILEKKKSIENKRLMLSDEVKSLSSKNNLIMNQINKIEEEIKSLKDLSKELDKKISVLNTEKMGFEKSITELRNSERDKLAEREKIALEIARLKDKRFNIQKEYDIIIAKLWDDYELTRREAMASFKAIENTPQINKELNELRLKIKNLGMVNVSAVEEYKQVSERYEFMKNQIEDVEKSKKELYKLITDLTSQMKSLFIDRFNKINENFNIIFKELFGGGNAELSLTDRSDILSSGIDIFVQPPGKIVTHLEALSGGERALIAIALYFAIMKVSPAPFCVLDEIEAALDEINVDKFAAYLRRMNKNTQFIIITHRRGTMEEADLLYGVTMQDEGISKLLELRTSEVEKDFVS